MNLNGLWEYAIRPAAEEQPEKWDGEILVPFPIESALSGVMKPVRPEERLWYRRKFPTPPLPSGGHLLLHFGAVDWKCTVWVNGKQVGEHTGGYDPFTFDITDALRSGRKRIGRGGGGSDGHGQPAARQAGAQAARHLVHGGDGNLADGVARAGAGEYIESLKIVPEVDRGAVKVTVRAEAAKGCDVWVKARDGKVMVWRRPDGSGEAIDVPMPNAEYWSPDRPQLYELQVELVDDGQVVDTVNSYFGMRKIEVKKDAERDQSAMAQQRGAISIRAARSGLVAGWAVHAGDG